MTQLMAAVGYGGGSTHEEMQQTMVTNVERILLYIPRHRMRCQLQQIRVLMEGECQSRVRAYS
jgi:hypothetical protein